MAKRDEAKGLAMLTKSAGFTKRVKFFVDQGRKLITQNEKDVLIVDEARVIAEIIMRGMRARSQTFWHRVALGTVTGDLAVFNVAGTAANANITNMPLAQEFERDQIFFAKSFGAYLDPDASQADKRIIVQDHILEVKYRDRPIVQEKIRALPDGGGLDGELNSGEPNMANRVAMPFFLRFPPGQKVDTVVRRLVATGAANDLEVNMRGILGEPK